MLPPPSLTNRLLLAHTGLRPASASSSHLLGSRGLPSSSQQPHQQQLQLQPPPAARATATSFGALISRTLTQGLAGGHLDRSLVPMPAPGQPPEGIERADASRGSRSLEDK